MHRLGFGKIGIQPTRLLARQVRSSGREGDELWGELQLYEVSLASEAALYIDVQLHLASRCKHVRTWKVCLARHTTSLCFAQSYVTRYVSYFHSNRSYRLATKTKQWVKSARNWTVKSPWSQVRDFQDSNVHTSSLLNSLFKAVEAGWPVKDVRL